MNVGKSIKKRREAAGLSQLELALQMGEGLANPSDISRIENGKQWPTREKLEAIAGVFRCAVYELFRTGDEEVPPPRVSERPAVYILGNDDPSIDQAMDAVIHELPPVDERTQAVLAVEIYKAAVAKHSADRIVGAINSLVMAVEQLKQD